MVSDSWINIFIGGAINGRPKFGIIHKPYYTPDGIMSKTYLGSLETGCYCSEYFDYMEDYKERDIYRNFEYEDPFHNE